LTNNQTLRFIQTGDWHLFANHSTWPLLGFQARDARLRQCIQKIFSYSHDADFLVLTGDLVDSRQIQADNKRLAQLAWLDRELKLLGRDKVVVTYGSHDDQSVRDWFSSRIAHRKRLNADVYTIEYPSRDLIFYAVDSGFEKSKDQPLKLKNAIDTILTARKNDHRNVGMAILLTQLNEGNKALIQPLRGYITYAALGDHHFGRLLPDTRLCASYSGAPVARDACTNGDSGSRYFVEVSIDSCGQAIPRKIPLPTGGRQVKVKGVAKGVLVIDGPGPENNHKVEMQKPQDLPKIIVDKINQITNYQWTSIALVDSVPYQKDVLRYIERVYKESTQNSFSTPTRKGAMYYFVR
jgi:DNA repair exonuclease SbcCD nuclease subunit